jgi:uncharacterized membrane protein
MRPETLVIGRWNTSVSACAGCDPRGTVRRLCYLNVAVHPMTQIEPGQTQQPVVSNTSMALIVYILYFVAYFVGITAIVGVVIAHVQKGSGNAMLDSHYDFQIRTFWVGVLYLIVGFVLMFVLIGFLVWGWWFVWSLIRNIKGILALNENRPIANPSSWLFG